MTVARNGKIRLLSCVLQPEHTPDGLLREFDSLLATEEADVRIIPFGCETASIEWLDNRISGDKHVTLLRQQGRLSEFRLDYAFTESGHKRQGHGRSYVLQHAEYPKVFITLTIEPSHFYHRALLPLLQSAYPKILMTFITHKKMRRLLETFKGEGGYTDLVIARASQRLRYQEGHVTPRIMPVVSWPSMTLADAFDWIHEHNGWFESITFDVMNEQQKRASMSLTRQGILRANGLLTRAFRAFIDPVCKTIHENLELFGHRARLERRDFSTRPLVIDFENDQFHETEENQRLIKSIRRLRTASISVLHGNPYVHLSVLDYLDSSAFDLWVLDERQIVIVPQLKASVGAIKRLINHIFDNYAEGRLANYTSTHA